VAFGFFTYLDWALEDVGEAKRDRETFPDVEPADRLVALGNQVLDDDKLSAFRIDLLNAFPSRVESSALPPSGELERETAELPLELHSFLGKTFRGYQIEKCEGRGGYGAVFVASHPTLRIKRALKLFLDVDRSGPHFEQFRERCLAEARLQAALKSPNIVQIIDVFEDQGYVVLVMEYIQGGNLAHLIEERNEKGIPFTPVEVLDLAIPIVAGVAHAHKHGIVHRDIKPENILIDEEHGGCPKVADFGLARDLEKTGQRQRTAGHLVGTPRYMAPEQVAATAKSYDRRSDIYSIGIVLYELCLGAPPFDHEDRYAILRMHEKEIPESLSLKLENFPEQLDRIILTCLEKKPSDRFTSTDELLLALERCREQLSLGVTRVDLQSWERRTIGRRRKRLALVAGVLGLLMLAAIPGYPLLLRWLSAQQPGAGLADRKGPITLSSAQHDDVPGKEPERPAREPAPKDEGSTPAAPDRKDSELPARETADRKAAPLPPKIRETPPPALPLREQLARYPMSAEDIATLARVLDVFGSHRSELALREYDATQKDLGALAPARKTEYTSTLIDAARDLVRLSNDLVLGRWKELAETKGQIRLSLTDGGMAEGAVDHVGDRAITLTDPQGGKTDIQFTKIAPEAWIQGKTIPVALVAYQALSGDAVKALDLALKLEKDNEKIALWFPVLVRLARLRASDLVKTAILEAEAPLSRQEKKVKFLKGLPHYLPAAAALHALSDVEVEISGIYPSLEREFKEAKREGEALELLLDGAPSRVLSNYAGTEAYPIAGTLVLAGFIAEIEGAHNDLMGDAGWLKYDWELRPDELKLEDRLQFWDRLHGEGCFIRDPKGPRSLIMGRPHPRTGEGLVIVYQFEPMGEDRDNAEWRLNLRREGGGNTYLRFAPGSISLRTFGLDSAVKPETLASVTVPRDPAEPRFHTCVLIPGEKLQVYLDGTIVACLTKEDTILPSQLSLVVVHGKLSVESILAMKKPAK
jgi:serine/threonine protein kinase